MQQAAGIKTDLGFAVEGFAGHLQAAQGCFVSGRIGDRPINGFSQIKSGLERRSKASGWAFHDIRRTGATIMGELDIPRLHISLVLNHAIPGVTSVYDRHSYLPQKKAALAKWAKAVIEITRNG